MIFAEIDDQGLTLGRQKHFKGKLEHSMIPGSSSIWRKNDKSGRDFGGRNLQLSQNHALANEQLIDSRRRKLRHLSRPKIHTSMMVVVRRKNGQPDHSFTVLNGPQPWKHFRKLYGSLFFIVSISLRLRSGSRRCKCWMYTWADLSDNFTSTSEVF